MIKKYYTLLIRFTTADKWSIQFGDYSKEVVKQEQLDCFEDVHDTKIVCTLDDQTAINQFVQQLNAELI